MDVGGEEEGDDNEEEEEEEDAVGLLAEAADEGVEGGDCAAAATAAAGEASPSPPSPPPVSIPAAFTASLALTSSTTFTSPGRTPSFIIFLSSTNTGVDSSSDRLYNATASVGSRWIACKRRS